MEKVRARVRKRASGSASAGSRIRDAFATDKAEARRDKCGAEQIEIASAELVKILVALEGRPWAEMGKARKPMTQNRLARMLKPLAIGPQKVGPEDARVSGYVRARFEDVFERYLPPLPDLSLHYRCIGGPSVQANRPREGVSQPDSRTERDEMGTSDISKPDSLGDDCPVAKSQKSNNDGLLSTCPVAKEGLGGETPVCAYCGRPGGNPWDYGGETVYLHPKCEAPYVDGKMREQGVA